MKKETILVISDLHLTTNFRKRKFKYLTKLISKADRVIINGDFWSCYYCTFDQFLNSKWKGLFPMLKERKAVYIHGNHDQEKWCDDRMSLFSDYQGNEYVLEVGEKKYLFSHGHLLLPKNYIDNEKYMKFWRFFKFDAIIYFLETILSVPFGRNIYRAGAAINEILKTEVAEKIIENLLNVGHTHWAEFDSRRKFSNSGLIHSGISNYVLIEDGSPKLILERYHWPIKF